MIEIPPRLIRVGERMYTAAYSYRRTVAYTLYLAVVAVAYATAFLLRFDFAWRPGYGTVFALSLLPLLAIRLVSSCGSGSAPGAGGSLALATCCGLAVATTAGSVVFGLLVWVVPFSPHVPRTVVVMEWLFTTTFTAALWTFYRTVYEQVRHHLSGFNGSAKRVLIIGAGEAGNLLVREMLRYPTGYRPIGFVDDDSMKWGMLLRGVEVIGATRDLVAIAKAERADEIIIAVPSAPPSEMRRIVECCESTGLPFKVLPGIAQVLAGDVRINQLRDVRIEDLLGREPVQLTLPELAADLRGRRVLITGAAGSIGSELARQVALHGPGTLVLFDQAETDLFYIEMELREKHPDLALVPVIGDIVDPEAVESVFREYQPERVYHAAAYKHVPMMECNQREAIRNNVIGTWRVADAAGRHGADKFVLVSTDKAVQPVSVMGATKRLAELVVLELQARHHGTTYAAVRFGNVLGSNGSVHPHLQEAAGERQAADCHGPRGDPVLHDDPGGRAVDPAGVALAGGARKHRDAGDGRARAHRGLAKNLLRLAGLDNRDGGRIVYTGLRPGERLHETVARARRADAPDGHSQGTPGAHERRLRCDGAVTASRMGARVPGRRRRRRYSRRCGICFPGLDGGTLISQAVQGHASMQNLTAAP